MGFLQYLVENFSLSSKSILLLAFFIVCIVYMCLLLKENAKKKKDFENLSERVNELEKSADSK